MTTATTLSNTNYGELKKSINLSEPDITGINIPTINVNTPEILNISELADNVIGSEKVFNSLLESLSVHLQNQVDKGYINRSEYSNVYIQHVNTALDTALQFVLQRNQMYYTNMLVFEQIKQQNIVNTISKAELETAKLNTKKSYLDVENTNVSLAVNKAQLANLDAQYNNLVKEEDIKDLQINSVIPKQNLLLDEDRIIKQKQQTELDTNDALKQHELTVSMPKKDLLLDVQKIGIEKDNLIKVQQALNLEKDLDIKDKQLLVMQEQIDLTVAQQGAITKDNLVKDAQIDNLEKDLLIKEEQIATENIKQDLLYYQADAEKAKTSNTTQTDVTVAGTIGKDIALKQAQKELVEQQKTSFIQEGAIKIVNAQKEIFNVVSSTAETPITPPSCYQNAAIQDIFEQVAALNGLTLGS